MDRTPNVPRTKGSFFHRKYRDISNCPPTPATPKLITTPSRRLIKRLKQDQDDSITSDYSTPKTTRTPVSITKLRGKKITHLIYRPLELDTESSSESTDNNFRRRKISPKSKTLTTTTTPLAIEAAATSTEAASSPVPVKSLPIELEQDNGLKEVGDDGDTKSSPCVSGVEIEQAINSDSESVIIVGSSKPKVDNTEPLVGSSEPPTPPVTPEKAKEEISTFVPGNMWICKSTQQERKSALEAGNT